MYLPVEACTMIGSLRWSRVGFPNRAVKVLGGSYIYSWSDLDCWATESGMHWAFQQMQRFFRLSIIRLRFTVSVWPSTTCCCTKVISNSGKHAKLILSSFSLLEAQLESRRRVCNMQPLRACGSMPLLLCTQHVLACCGWQFSPAVWLQLTWCTHVAFADCDSRVMLRTHMRSDINITSPACTAAAAHSAEYAAWF